MRTLTLAQPTAPEAAWTAEDDRSVPPVVLTYQLAVYGVAEPVIPRGDWERADWDCLARRAGA
jgi:hypothetical protein